MDLKIIAQKLNIDSYPEALDQIKNWNGIPDISDPQWVEETEKTYPVLGKYYPLVLQAAQELQEDHARYQWGMSVAKYLSHCTASEARDIPIPARDGTLAGDFLPLLILLTLLPSGIAECRRRKMPEDMIRRNFDHIVDGISIVEYETERPAINLVYFRWLVKFFKVVLFNCYGFNFEIRSLPGEIYVLQDKHSGALSPVFYKGCFHYSGKILNSAGCLETDDHFYAEFAETEDQYIAQPCINGLIKPDKKVFPKAQYRLVAKSGDTVLSVHIPRGTDISPHNTAKSLLAALKDVAVYYPEHNIKAFYCHSWLLDPKFNDILEPGAKIPQFGNLFTRYPAKSSGKEVFSFVFRRTMPLENLPENTSLERALKQHYINGNYILAYSGIVLPEQL